MVLDSLFNQEKNSCIFLQSLIKNALHAAIKHEIPHYYNNLA